MNIQGRPDELASFIRCINDEPERCAPSTPRAPSAPAGDNTWGFILTMLVMLGGFLLLALMMGHR